MKNWLDAARNLTVKCDRGTDCHRKLLDQANLKCMSTITNYT